MHRHPRRTIGALALATAMALLTCGALASADAVADPAGAVHFMRSADSGFDQYTEAPSPEAQAWMREHVGRMIAWSPYFDSRTRWYPNAWVYRDAYAIYPGSSLASEHPEWIAKDAAGTRLYIPYGCSGGTCPQYAADISNPAFRRYWIERVSSEVAHGYKGVYVDDVNMNMRVGNGREESVAPIDPSTGRPMSDEQWRGYMATFMEEVRQALPQAEIVHNVIWFADEQAGTSNASIRAEIQSANYIGLERGVNDEGLTGGDGQWSLASFLAYVDQVHATGRGIIMEGASGEGQGLEYNLAAYFLESTGNDFVSGKAQTPTHWWPGWSADLGEATGARYTWGGLLRRDFNGGIVLLNPPGSPARTVGLPGPMRNSAGQTVSSVTLAAASGAVLTGVLTSSSTPGPGQPTPAPTPTETMITVETKPDKPKTAGTTTNDTGTTPTETRSSAGAVSTGTTHKPGPTPRKHRRHARKHKRPARLARANPRPSRQRAVLASIKGSVLGANRGQVTIQIQALRGRAWVTTKSLTVSVNQAGRFERMLHLVLADRYRVRAVYGGAPGYRPSRSSYRLVVYPLTSSRRVHGRRASSHAGPAA